MTSHVGRLYALALALVVFFLTWATVARAPLVGARHAARRPAGRGARRAPAASPARKRRRRAHRPPALGDLPKAVAPASAADRRSEPLQRRRCAAGPACRECRRRSRGPRGCRAVGPRREPAAGDGHEDVVKDPTFWILARASGLTAYALMTVGGARRSGAQVAAVRPRAEGSLGDRRPPLPVAARARGRRRCTGRRWCSTRP